MRNDYNKFKIQDFENDHSSFTPSGLDILSYIENKNAECSDFVKGFAEYGGEYYKGARNFIMNGESLYNKHCSVPGVSAEVFLGYAYNELGVDSPIYYPYFISQFLPKKHAGIILPDGVVSKDITKYFFAPTQFWEEKYNTLDFMANSEKGQIIFAREGIIEKIKEIIISLAFNNKDAGLDNSFWVRNLPKSKYDHIISIDHEFCGRDSLYENRKSDLIDGLYRHCERGYNSMFCALDDRKSTIDYVLRLLNGENINGLVLTDDEIKQLNLFIEQIKKLSFNDITSYIKNKFQFTIYPKFVSGMECCREDLCSSLER